VRLIVEVQAVGDQAFDLDFGWTFGTAAIAAKPAFPAVSMIAPIATVTAAARTTVAAARSTGSAGPTGSATLSRRPALPALLLWFLLFWHR
jgi:hypothetical protein